MRKLVLLLVISMIYTFSAVAQNLEQLWKSPNEDSKSWVYWYWMHAAVTKEGITADLEAMKANGLAGAYLMPIHGTPETPFVTPSAEQLSPVWWDMVKFAFEEADRVGLQIGFHVCDGFALAGGPWITPELSMQKVVWNETLVEGGEKLKLELEKPTHFGGYYKDIALFAYPTRQGEGVTSYDFVPKVTTNVEGVDPQILAQKGNEKTFRSVKDCWIQYSFEKPFTARSIEVIRDRNNFQSQRFLIQASDDGINFRDIMQLTPPRQGWQEVDFAKLGREFPITHSIPETTAKYFRFVYDRAGTEPGSEDIDAAKWKQTLKILGIKLSSQAYIHNHEGKSGLAWRVAPWTTDAQLSEDQCVNPDELINITKYLDKNGILKWDAPKGDWTILRMGHTSNGYDNGTGGGGAGLECDKFNPKAVQLQFDSWFAKAFKLAGKNSKVITVFHVDSWECGSQNWSPVFRDEFKKRRGYDIVDHLPVMAGIPLKSADNSERILHDVRQTISELVADNFYGTLKTNANDFGCKFSAECVSPTMLSDGMMHYKNVDIPMGEYWLQSPTHDKPNDILDAISGARMYGKNIVQAESFTQLRLTFDEHPGMVKTLQDRHYALGINRLSYHVYALNPWLDRSPGMTLDGIGLFFQRDQTWWDLGKAWVDYAQRCQALLQYGKPVVDIAVFTGEELPRRALLPDRVVPFLPGIFGEERVKSEKIRLANEGELTHEMPVGVSHSMHLTTAEDWVNALRGYSYDSMNPDALLNLAKVVDGRIVLDSGMSYAMLVVPGKHPMHPNPERMSVEVFNKIKELRSQGAIILMESEKPDETIGYEEEGEHLSWNGVEGLISLPYQNETFDELGIPRDFIVTEGTNAYAENVGYAHRKDGNTSIYFITNQESRRRLLDISLRALAQNVEIWNPVTSEIFKFKDWQTNKGRTDFQLQLDANESLFIVLTDNFTENNLARTNVFKTVKKITTPWQVTFDSQKRGPKETVIFDTLTDWSENENQLIKYYSGTAFYKNTFKWFNSIDSGERYYLEIEDVSNLADVKINDISCGIIWTYPYRVDITDALKKGDNTISIEVVNTWANRIMGDEDFDAESDDSKKIWTNARFRMKEKKLVKSGIIGNVVITTNQL